MQVVGCLTLCLNFLHGIKIKIKRANFVACCKLTHFPLFEALNTTCYVIDKKRNRNLCEEQMLLLAYTETTIFQHNKPAVVARC